MHDNKCYDGVGTAFYNHTLQDPLIWIWWGGWSERVPRESDMEGDTWSISRIQPSKEMEKNLSVTVSIIRESMETKEDVVFFEEEKLNLTKS